MAGLTATVVFHLCRWHWYPVKPSLLLWKRNVSGLITAMTKRHWSGREQVRLLAGDIIRFRSHRGYGSHPHITGGRLWSGRRIHCHTAGWYPAAGGHPPSWETDLFHTFRSRYHRLYLRYCHRHCSGQIDNFGTHSEGASTIAKLASYSTLGFPSQSDFRRHCLFVVLFMVFFPKNGMLWFLHLW